MTEVSQQKTLLVQHINVTLDTRENLKKNVKTLCLALQQHKKNYTQWIRTKEHINPFVCLNKCDHS